MDQNVVNNYCKFLEIRGLKLNIITKDNISEPVYRCTACVNDSPVIEVSAAGFTAGEARCRAILRLAADLEFSESLSRYYMGASTASELIMPFEKMIDLNGPDEIFNREFNELYDLENWPAEAFAEQMTWDTGKIRSYIFTNDTNGKKVPVSASWLKTVFGFDCICAADSQEKAAELSCFRECRRYISNELLISPNPLNPVPEKFLPEEFFRLSDWCDSHNFKLRIYDASINGRYPSAVAAALFRQKDQKVRFCVGMAETTAESVKEALLELFETSVECDHAFHEITFNYSSALTSSNITRIALNISGYLPADLFACNDCASEESCYSSHHDGDAVNTDREIILENVIRRIDEDCELESDGYTLTFDREGLFFCWKIRPGYSEISDASLFDTAMENTGNIYRDFILHLGEREEDYSEFPLSMEDNNIMSDTGVADMLGIYTRSTSCWHSMLTGELCALTEMHLGNHESALNYIETYLEDISFQDPDFIDIRKLNFYRCCRDILSIKVDNDEFDFRTMLISLYGKDIFDMAESACNGSSMYIYKLNGDYLYQVPEHAEVIKNYEEIRKALACN